MHAVLHAAPVFRVSSPGYPTRLAVAADPRLLRRLPPGWLSQHELRTAAGLLFGLSTLPGLVGCPRSDLTAVTLGDPGSPEPLTEQQALDIIRDTLAERGVNLTAANVPLSGVKWVGDQRTEDPFVADLTDANGRIAVEYVTLSEHDSFLTADTFDIDALIDQLTADVRAAAPDVYFAAFPYEMATWPPTEAEIEQARQNLRARVLEFADWLAAQGVI